MGILDTLRTENLAHNLAGKNVLVTGGTKGIGAGVAYHFAELGANVAIAGRSTKEAELLLQRLRGVSPNPDAKFEFFYLDAQLNSNSIAFADQMREKYAAEGLYALAMSQDAIADGPRKDTVEGHEWTGAVGAFSRYIIAVKLIDVLRIGGGTILSIKAGGKFNTFDADDIDLKKLKNVAFLTGSKRVGVLNDIFAQEITARTGITFYHLFPGFVKTVPFGGLKSSLMVWLVSTAVSLFGQPPELYAAVPVHVALTRPDYITVQQTGKDSPLQPFPKREDVRAKVMAWMKDATGVEIDDIHK